MFFHGNHDMWMFDYLEKEAGATIYANPIELKVKDQLILLGHGDGLGPGDAGYKLLRKIFRNPICQFLFRILPPSIGMGIAHKWSRSSRISSGKYDESFKEEKEILLSYCKDIESKKHHDYYLFGHRHLTLDIPFGESSRYLNLGEWVYDSNYAVFDGTMRIIKFEA